MCMREREGGGLCGDAGEGVSGNITPSINHAYTCMLKLTHTYAAGMIVCVVCTHTCNIIMYMYQTVPWKKSF